MVISFSVLGKSLTINVHQLINMTRVCVCIPWNGWPSYLVSLYTSFGCFAPSESLLKLLVSDSWEPRASLEQTTPKHSFLVLDRWPGFLVYDAMLTAVFLKKKFKSSEFKITVLFLISFKHSSIHLHSWAVPLDYISPSKGKVITADNENGRKMWELWELSYQYSTCNSRASPCDG